MSSSSFASSQELTSAPAQKASLADGRALREPADLNIKSLTKRYPGVVALRDVDLSLKGGSIHALVGENGAGKSTLIKVLAGVVRPDSGELNMNGSALKLRNPLNARSAGIAVVHQHTNLIPDMTVAENFALRQGYPRLPTGSVAWREMRRRAKRAAEILLPSLDVEKTTATLTGVEKQMLELAFGLAADPRILILDEPTAVLPHSETQQLFERVKEYAQKGGAILFVSHRLNEVFELADHVTVLRDGQRVWSQPTADVTSEDLIRAMVGRAVTFSREGLPESGEEKLFEVRGLSDAGGAFRDVSFNIRRGEIYGLYGLVGAGQSQLCAALFGLRGSTGEVKLGDESIRGSASTRADRGIAYVTAERLERAVFRQMTVGENMSLAALRRRSSGGVLRMGAEESTNENYRKDLRVKTTSLDQNILQLSGGNQQKVLLGRWLQTEPRVLILEEPTQGVDVGAKEEIYRIIRELASKGVSMLLVTSELPELLALSHRFGIMREGKLVTEMDGAAATDAEILRAALPDAGSKNAGAAKRRSGGLTGVVHWMLAQREVGLATVLLLIVALAAIFVPAFGTPGNMRDVMANQSILLVAALGMTAVIISGGIDISVGAILGLAAMAAGKLDKANQATWLIALVPIAVGLLLGLWNGALTVLGRVHSIVITLGMLFILRGVMLVGMENKWIFNLSERTTVFGVGNVFGVPVLIASAALCLVLMHLFLRHTVSGRNLYALGGSASSAELLGVNPRRTVPLAFAISGALVGFAGLLNAANYGNVQTNVGQGFELKVIAATVIGGTHIMGGRGSAFGTLLGVLFLGVLSNLQTLMHISPFWENAVLGGMILLAIGADALLTRSRRADA